MKQKFSLIELIVVIAIIGILASIIVPNIQTLKSDANITGIKANTRVFQTAVDMYSLKNNGLYPAKEQPTIFVPQPIDVEILYPKYLKTLPKDQGGKYWVDYMGKVWGSTVDAPIGINYEPTEISWETVQGSNEYGVYKYEGTAPTGFLGNKSEFAKFKGNVTINSKVGSYTREANTIYLINAIDRYGLETAPVGNGYEGYNPQFPITGIGDFYFTTNAGGIAVWDGIQKTEITPSGTNITYTYATSNDGITYTAYTTDFKNLPNSKYMKVKATMTSSGTTKPTIKILKVLFHLVGSQGVNENSNEIDITGTVNAPQSSNVIIDNVNKEITIVDGQMQGTVVNIIPIPNGNTVTDVITSVTNPNGGVDTSNVQNQTNNNGTTGYTQTYQVSTDGGTTWQPIPPTPYISELPSGGTHIKIITVITRPSASDPSPSMEDITVVSAKPQAGSQQPTENWTTIDTKDYIVDATQEGDWISVDTTQTTPQDTRIVYEYRYSNDGNIWSNSYSDISLAPNSRMLKVTALLQKKPTATQNPEITEVFVNYKLVSNGQDIIYDSNNPQSGGTGGEVVYPSIQAIITMTPDTNITTSTVINWDYSSSTSPYGTIVNAEWQGKQTTYPTEGTYVIKLRVQDSTGKWSNWTETQIIVANNLSGIKKIISNTSHAMALYNDGTLKAWGYSMHGQVGYSGMNYPTPITLSVAGVRDVAVGREHSMILMNDGTVKSWGSDDKGQLGSVTQANLNSIYNSSYGYMIGTPTTIPGLTNVTKIVAGRDSSFAILNDGTVKAWGYNGAYGILGLGTTTDQEYTPVTIPNLTNVKDVIIGTGEPYSSTAVYALLNDGTVKVWGYNGMGQFGDGTINGSTTPVNIPALTGVKQIVSGHYSTAALKTDGTILTIGYNNYGQLGNGSQANSTTFTTVYGITNATQISAGWYHMTALLSDGTVKSWGRGNLGSLGTGSTYDSSYPVTVSGITNAKQITSGAYSSYALLSDDITVKAWGLNSAGQLGDSSTSQSNVPVEVKNLK